MRQQGNIFQTKEQDETPEEELSAVLICNIPDKEFKVMTAKMLKELRRRMDEQSETFK